MSTIKTESITATYPAGQYPIYIGKDLFKDIELLCHHIASNQVMIVTNESIAPLYLAPLKQAFKHYHCDTIILPDGEQYKTLDQMSLILDALINHSHHRDTTIVALGGGVIGDMSGFAAACYQRGVAYIQIPTSLLAQVDASIGGKTAVNHPKGKNLIGAFHQPLAVIIDIATLNTLPDREFRAGLAEVIKAALINNSIFFNWLEDNIDLLLDRNPAILTEMIKQACLIKRDIVAADEKEQGIRAWLNLGHTFAHAIEQNLGYGKWLHGEAVAVGLIIAADLSVTFGWLPEKDLNRIVQIITTLKLPKNLPSEIKYDKLLAAMKGDKKILDNQIRFVLLKSIGNAVITKEVTEKQLKEVLYKYTARQ